MAEYFYYDAAYWIHDRDGLRWTEDGHAWHTIEPEHVEYWLRRLLFRSRITHARFIAGITTRVARMYPWGPDGPMYEPD